MHDDPSRPQGPDDPDWAPDDDVVIARAFRRSVWTVLIVGVFAVALYFMLRPDRPTEQAVAKDLEALPRAAQPEASVPRVRFTDVTRAAGVRFVHTNGARGDKLLPETMGGGVAFLDYDGDDDPDLLFVNSTRWPEDDRLPRPTPALYRNDGSGRFEEVSALAGLTDDFYGMGVAVGDFDNDGDPDLFMTALGTNRLYRNDGGRFLDVTRAAGVAGKDSDWSTSAGFFDYDGDGDLDLFVCNYVRWSEQIDLELNFTLNGQDRAYGPPTNYEGAYPYLYRNDGDGTFSDVTAAAGMRIDSPLSGRPMGKALAVTFDDVDSDGNLDVLVANDTVQNFLFRSRGDGTFEEVGADSGFGFDGAGKATGAMGLDASHYRNDEQYGVAIANFANEMTSLYVASRGGLQFTDEAMGEGIGAPSRLVLSFGVFFFDYDLDGRLDFLQANGHLENEIAQVQTSQSYRQSAQLFWNAGPEQPSCFVAVPAEQLGDLARPIVGRGAAFADIDADGDLDIVLTQVGDAPLLLRNELEPGPRWVRLKLIGTSSNRDAIGARVELSAGGVTQLRRVMPTRSYLSQVEPVLTFGLGAASRIDRLTVIWPDGSRQEVDRVEFGRLNRILQAG